MSTPDFSTAENNQELANEVSCLKAMLTLMLQAMGQADAGRVMLKMEKQLAHQSMILMSLSQAVILPNHSSSVGVVGKPCSPWP